MTELCKLLEETASALEDCIQDLSSSFERPVLTTEGSGYPAFRHAPEHRTDVLASYLKSVHSMSAINGALVLLRAGHVSEAYQLCRSIDEGTEDIAFLAMDSTEAEPHQQRFVNDFFREEVDSRGTDKIAAIKRDRPTRAKIQALLSRIPLAEFNPSDTTRIQKLLHRVFSGYVHGAYPHIMELYGGHPGKYHTSGMLGTPRVAECERQLVSYIYRAALGVEAVAARAERRDVAKNVLSLAIRFARETGCVGDSEVELMTSRLAQLGGG